MGTHLVIGPVNLRMESEHCQCNAHQFAATFGCQHHFISKSTSSLGQGGFCSVRELFCLCSVGSELAVHLQRHFVKAISMSKFLPGQSSPAL